MAIETATEFAAFVSTDEFGVVATYRSIDGSSTSINGIFDEPFEAVDVEAGAPIGSRRASFECVSSDLPASAAQCDEIDIGANSYVIAEIEPDGTGMTVLTLDKT